MGCVLTYPAPKGSKTLWHLLKGQLDGKPCRWQVTVWYDVGILQDTEKNPRVMKFKTDKAVDLQDLMRSINVHLDPDHRNCGGITNVRWRAVQER